MTETAVRPPWQRPDPDLADYRPVIAYPAPKRPDPGPARVPAAVCPEPAAGAPAIAYAPAAAPPAIRPVPAPPPASAWRPQAAGPARACSQPDRAGPAAVTWCRPPSPGARPASHGRPQVTIPAPAYCDGDINYDPPEISFGTGLQQSNPDGSWVVHPLSVIEPGCEIGDEGPINEAFLSTPVVYLAAGRPYALASPVVIPDGATLYVNRAAIDREQFIVGEGATVYD